MFRLVIRAFAGSLGRGFQSFEHIALGDLFYLRIQPDSILAKVLAVVSPQRFSIGQKPGLHALHHPEDRVLRPNVNSPWLADGLEQLAIIWPFAID